ncbi:MAG: MarR family winged helix-turn-helix transcriptional regulator [Planctomycetaceae bacterium]
MAKAFNTRTSELNQALESLHFAFRAVVARPDAMLAERGLSRVHHRILYFIAHRDPLSVNDLLKVLGITKQSLNGPLRQLLELELVTAVPDPVDGRIKRLKLTKEGSKLEKALSGDQRRRFERVFAQVGPDAEMAWRKVMALLTQ